ncbi:MULTISPECIES: helix-turn-helix transcriptional regulator [Aminobacterium]|uniref:helix-turn-helix transcriptional regulator n=1 Tax=Aminobacterium TaxID=81466 RepID=UPI00257FD682|nr:hypothetical protein [Aminobacterium sp. UBA4834]
MFRNRQTDYAVPTGEIIEEHVKYLHMSQECFAQKMGLTQEETCQLFEGTLPVTPSMSIKLERILGVSSSFWLRLEKLYREDMRRLAETQKREVSDSKG